MGKLSQLFTASILKLLTVNLSGGLLFGIVIGYVAVYTTLDAKSRSCDDFESEKACKSVSHSVKCLWNGNACIYKDTNDAKVPYQCKNIDKKESVCKQAKHCHWDYGKGDCVHDAGMSAAESGIYAGAMTVGGMAGSFAAGPLAGRFGRKWCIFAAGFIGIIGSLVIHAARAADIYALHVIGRIFLGVASGAACVLSPMYIEEMAPADMKGVLGTTFQGGITSGIMFAALIGLLIEPRNKKASQHFEIRIQCLTLVQTILCVCYTVVGFCIPESEKYVQLKELADRRARGEDLDAQSSSDNGEQLPDDAEYTISEMLFPLGVATFMCLVLQLTGINAIMNYAPKMTSQLGMKPLLGNFLIMLWNCITAFISIPVSSRVPLRKMFVTAIALAFISLMIVGIPTTPKVASKGARQAFGLLGIFMFIFVFEVGMGPPFYILCMQLFPYTFRNKGSAYSNGTVFIFNLIVNVFYPICVTGFSGGPSGNQDKGMAICFFFFAGCALVSFIVCLKWLFPFYDSPKGKQALAECAARRAAATEKNGSPIVESEYSQE